MGSLHHLDVADVLTHRLALRFQADQSLLLARVDSAAAALDRAGLPQVAEGLRQSSAKALAATEALLSRIDPERTP